MNENNASRTGASQGFQTWFGLRESGDRGHFIVVRGAAWIRVLMGGQGLD